MFSLLLDYLSHRQQHVQIDDKRSKRSCINFGVLQNSILEPVLIYAFQI